MPDSGADISAAGEEILAHLNEHIDNLLPSTTVPKAANITEMHPVGKLPICLKLGNTESSDDLHIYLDVSGILISWKACKNLGILPDCYPHPPASTKAICTTTLDESPIDIISTDAGTSMLTKDSIINEFPRVFDGIIRAMDGEQFHIHLTSDAKPFCVTSPRSIPFAYVTGSTKTVLIAQDRKFDFFTQTQSLMNALSSFTATVDQSKVVCFCWLLF